MAKQRLFPIQIDVTGTTANQILISDGANAYWGNSSSSFDSSNLTTGLSGANTAIVNLQTGLSGSNTAITNLTTGLSGSNTNITNLTTGLSGSNTAITNLTTGLTGANTNIANITANPVTFQSDVTIQGNVYLRGNALTFTSNTISFGDSLLSLAANNTINDVIDIGLYGHYNTGAANSHTGLFRSAVSKDWTLFTGYTIDLDGNTTINISDPSFGYANLRLNVANALSVYSNGVELRANDYATLLSAQSNDYSTYTTLNTRINTVQSNISASGAITVVDEGNTLTTALTSITFTGAGVTGSNVGNAVTVTIPSETSNVINLQTGLSGANTNINTVQSNLAAYATYANSTFSGGGGVNQNAAYSWTNVHTFSNTITINAVSANGSLGTAGQVLSSTGTDTQWIDAGSGGGFSNNQSIAVSSLYYSSSTINKLYTYYNNTTFSLDTIFV